jgi:hypothetical protein
MKRYGVVFCFITVIMFTFGLSLQAGSAWIDSKTIETVKDTLLKMHGEQNRSRIERGIQQTALFWKEEDGSPEEFAAFCQENFIASPEALDTNFKRLETYTEILGGYFTEMSVDLNQYLSLDWGEILPIDRAFGEFNPAAHVFEDFFSSKIAFSILLNFPYYTLEEKTKLGDSWSRKEWAYAREGDLFTSRIPAAIQQEITQKITQADVYISQYNIYMGTLIDAQKNTYFPADLKLISHWDIRDEIKARYKDPKGLFKQKMIYKVMERIIEQSIPQIVIDSPKYLWDPFTNKTYEKESGQEIIATPEPDTRYKHLLDMFNAVKKADAYNPYFSNFIQRKFQSDREILEADVEALFKELISSPEAKKVARLIQKRLKRQLQPFDIWYNGFKSGLTIPEEELNKIAAQKYPGLEAFRVGIGDILVKLGFPRERAEFIAPLIRVDPARGSGHCAGASMKTAKVRLRTRIPKSGMDYKGFNTAMHELGHAVESTLNLQGSDYYILGDVPNTAFTEAFAFVFGDRDLDILGLARDNTNDKYLKALDIFWNAYEIMGVALVDMKTWNWMYKNPTASPSQLKNAVISFAKEIWNQYYAPVFNVKDQTLLAIYSHMLESPLYLPDYPLGHVIQFQIENYLEGKIVGKEMERMCAAGEIIPQLWMKNAVGANISVKPLLEAVNQALKHISK